MLVRAFNHVLLDSVISGHLNRLLNNVFYDVSNSVSNIVSDQ